MKRHIGKIKNTDQRCVVVFMQIPGREDHALVVSTDTLPPRYEQALMQIVESPEGQNDPSLANVLDRRLMPDTGEKILEAMHNNGFLRAVPIDQVIMLPMPSMPFPLRSIIEKMGGTVPNSPATAQDVTETAADEKFNPHGANAQALTAESKAGIARMLLIEAEDLEAIAQQKRQQAYAYAPEIASVASGASVGEKIIAETTTKKTRAKRKTASTETGV